MLWAYDKYRELTFNPSYRPVLISALINTENWDDDSKTWTTFPPDSSNPNTLRPEDHWKTCFYETFMLVCIQVSKIWSTSFQPLKLMVISCQIQLIVKNNIVLMSFPSIFKIQSSKTPFWKGAQTFIIFALSFITAWKF